MAVVGRIESVMADGDRLQLFYELCGAWCAFIPRLTTEKSNVDYFRQLHVRPKYVSTCGEKYPVTRGSTLKRKWPSIYHYVRIGKEDSIISISISSTLS